VAKLSKSRVLDKVPDESSLILEIPECYRMSGRKFPTFHAITHLDPFRHFSRTPTSDVFQGISMAAFTHIRCAARCCAALVKTLFVFLYYRSLLLNDQDNASTANCIIHKADLTHN